MLSSQTHTHTHIQSSVPRMMTQHDIGLVSDFFFECGLQLCMLLIEQGHIFANCNRSMLRWKVAINSKWAMKRSRHIISTVDPANIKYTMQCKLCIKPIKVQYILFHYSDRLTANYFSLLALNSTESLQAQTRLCKMANTKSIENTVYMLCLP